MKILFCLLTFSVCGTIGYLYKRRLRQVQNFFEYLLEFEGYYNSNMTLFKNNVVDITSGFVALQKDGQKKFNEVFEKKGEIFEINKEAFKKFALDQQTNSVIETYLNNLGKNEYEFEKEKNKNFELYLKKEVEKAKKACDEKGSLYFKLSLALGAILCIIIW